MAEKFTVAKLRKYDGKGPDKKIYVAMNFKVYDVTEKGHEFYAEGKQYAMLAGRDASRAMGTMDISAIKDVFDDLKDLSEDDMDKIKEWQQKFIAKYQVMGTLVEG